MTKYNVGDKVWWAYCANTMVRKQCPVCFGKLRVTLVLGDGTAIELPCQACAPGYESPKGYIEEWEWVAEPKQVTIDEVRSCRTHDEEVIEYYANHYILREGETLFKTKKEAKSACLAKIAGLEEGQRRRRTNRIGQQKFEYSRVSHPRSQKTSENG
jgi:hypothetical protein